MSRPTIRCASTLQIPEEVPAASTEGADAGSSVWTPKELEMLQEGPYR